MIKRTFTILYHFCWYAFAFIILTAAVLVTVIRLALPEIGDYKNEIQSWVSEQMYYPVVIEEITAEWKGWTPYLYLKNIELYSPDNKTLISTFNSAHLGIAPFASINKRELVPSQLVISGIELEFTRNDDGSISINNTNNIRSNKSSSTAMSAWLLKQKHIKLENASLIWHDKKKQKEKLKFTNAELELKTHRKRLQISANITLAKNGDLNLRMDVFGNILTPDWKGDVYFEAKNISPEKLLEDLEIKSTGGTANAKVWTSWDKSKLIDISSEIQYSNFSLAFKEHTLPIESIKLDFLGKRKKEKDWLLDVNITELQTENGIWPTSNFQLGINNSFANKQYKGHFSYLKLQEITPFLLASKLLSEETINKFDWQSLKGELTNTDVFYGSDSSDEKRLLLNTDFKKVEIAAIDKQHAIYNLAGSLRATNNNIKLNINSSAAKVLFSSVYDNALPLSILNAELELINTDSVELLIKDFNIADGTISARSSGRIRFNKSNSPFIDIVAHIDETDIEDIPKYLPKNSSAKFKKWFTNAMVSGKLLYGDLVFHGHAADFPFENSEGNFKAILNIENATIDYNKKWPPMDQLTADVIIDGNDLTLLSNFATIFDASVNDLTVKVNQIGVKKPTFIVDTKISAHTTDVANFIKQSPLNKKPSLRQLAENITGGIDLKVGLTIPIGHSKPTVDGLASFTDTTIESGLSGLALEKVNGDVHFTNTSSWSNGIDALYHGRPVTLTIPKFDQHKSDAKPYIISGAADKDFFISELSSFFPALVDSSQTYSNKLSGKTNWSLTLKQPKDISKGKEIVFNTDLKGISVDLPYPIGKSATDSSPLSIKTNLKNLSIENININYNDVYADFIVNNKEDLTVKNILIGLGKPHPVIETSNKISIQGELEKFNTAKGGWLEYFTAEKKSSSAIKKKKNKIGANLLIKNLSMLGNEFNDVNVDLNNHNLTNGWQISFDGKDIKGETNFIISKNNQLSANLEKLTLTVAEQDKNNKITIDKIPELDVNIDEFIFNGNKLGKLKLLTNRIENGININNLSISKPGLDINATGEWTSIDDIDHSDFKATLKADTIGNMLSTFSFDAANIKKGQTNMEMNAHWPGTPMEFAMEKINGELDIKIDKGQLLDINPSAGRLFGLLSIQTLPRRLTLDFTDIFNKGFAFDNISGNFSVQQGHAYTNNLEMIGPAADIVVSGRTGLSTEDYDQIATVTPKVSSGIPVASALFGPVGVGVGAVIYLAGEVFNAIPEKIDQILKQQYTITGSWNAPNIEKIRKEKDSS